MAKKRYYVVWNGLVPGVYHTWDECQAQINGVKQALYKSFATLDTVNHFHFSFFNGCVVTPHCDFNLTSA